MKPFRLIGYICGCYLLMNCASTQVDKGIYAPCQCSYSIERDNLGRKQGREIWWHSNGEKKFEAFFKTGSRDGKFSAWYSNGRPWYEGFEKMGSPESTLTYWYPEGGIKSRALFRNGIQLERQDFNTDGSLINTSSGIPIVVHPESLAVPDMDKTARLAQEKLRQDALKIWAIRVRHTVESYWTLPAKFEKERPYRSIAKIKVSRDGKILGVTWLEKSPSADFNSLTQQVFKRIHRLPAFPSQIQDASLEVQYEFISLGKQIIRRKLEVREPRDGGLAEP